MSVTTNVRPAGFATIGQRIGAYFIDGALVGAATLVGILLSIVLGFLVGTVSPEAGVIFFMLGYVFAGLGYGIYVWYLTATKGYSPGKKLLGLRLVDVETGRPLGWWRVWLRGLVLSLVAVLTLGLGLILVAVLAGQHPKRQGWHDLAVKSVVVPESALTVSVTAPAPIDEGVLPVALPGADVAQESAPPPSVQITPAQSVRTPPPPPPSSMQATSSTSALIGPPPGVVAGAAKLTPIGPPPTVPATAASPIAAPAPVDESTRLATRRPATPAGWVFAPAFGTERVVTEAVLVGRDPDLSLSPGAMAWAVDDPEKTVSKTHALIGVDEGGPWIEDWDSTNGVLIRRGDVEIEPASRVRAPLESGDVIVLGDFEVQIRPAG